MKTKTMNIATTRDLKVRACRMREARRFRRATKQELKALRQS